MLAHAFLTVITAQQRPPDVDADLPDGQLPPLIRLTRNQIRHLFVQLTAHIQPTVTFILHWSLWRRHRQADARAAHYRRRAMTE